MERAVPQGLSETWDKTLHDPDVVGALGASRVLFKEISSWQAELVAEAIGRGATWEEIGAALGTTRQAAWARFRNVAERIEGRSGQMIEEVDAIKDQMKEQLNSLRGELKRLDAKWRQERAEAQRHLREQARSRAEERKALQERIRETATAFRDEIHRLRTSAPG